MNLQNICHSRLLRIAAALLSSFLIISSLQAQSGLDQYLVARWTFNQGSLKSDQGDFSLRKLDFGTMPTLSFEDGVAKLGPGTLLVCEAINSTDQPDLAKAVTIWLRVRFDAPIVTDSFFFGLRNQSPAGDWAHMVLSALNRAKPENNTAFFTKLGSDANLSSGSRNLPLEPGKFHTMALVFDGNTKTVTYLVDGQKLEGKHKDASALSAFNNFSIGRLKAAGANPPASVDEVRLYSVALTPEWIAEIEPVSNH